MAMRTGARLRTAHDAQTPLRKRFRRRTRGRRDQEFRAITLGPGHDDWAVVDPQGEIVYRGYALYAARLASELAQAPR